MKRMLFFVNPNAGHTEIRSNLLEVLQIFTKGGYEVTVHTTLAPQDLTRQIVERGGEYDIIVCTGGDGTLNEAVSGIMQLENRPPLGYIPGGTMNDVAFTLGIPKNVIAAAQNIVDGQVFTMDIGSFEGKWFTYVAAFGLFTDVSYDTPQEEKRILGRLAYLLNGVHALGEAKPVHVRMRCNGKTIEEDVIDGIVCSTMSVGGFRAPKKLGIRLNDGKFEVLLIRNFKNLADFSAAAACLLRAEFPEPYFITEKADRVEFEFDEDVPWTLDGEFGGMHKSVQIVNNQQALRILVPQEPAQEE